MSEDIYTQTAHKIWAYYWGNDPGTVDELALHLREWLPRADIAQQADDPDADKMAFAEAYCRHTKEIMQAEIERLRGEKRYGSTHLVPACTQQAYKSHVAAIHNIQQNTILDKEAEIERLKGENAMNLAALDADALTIGRLNDTIERRKAQVGRLIKLAHRYGERDRAKDAAIAQLTAAFEEVREFTHLECKEKFSHALRHIYLKVDFALDAVRQKETVQS